jgi:hypothetical protein
MPMQISVWYPAQPGGQPMRVGEYWAIAGRNQTLGAITESEVAASSARIRSLTEFPFGNVPPQATADSIRDLRTSAVRDANAVAGRFPLIVTALEPESGLRLAEYLASHGYVVVSAPTLGTAAQQVNRVQVAIEAHTRTLETVYAFALTLPFADTLRTGLIGVNFDGIAALVHQMRNMTAQAVVSLDGYETKTSSATGLRTSPYFDRVRMRVPYLAFAQDNAPPALTFSDSLARELKYSDRYAYVVRDLEHFAYVTDLMHYPQVRAEQRLGYEFVFRTIRAFLDTYVKGDTTARAFMTRSAVANGFPAWLLKTEVRLPALPPVPTAEELEQIAMAGDVERLRSILRAARAADPTARVFTVGDMSLYSFRFRQRPEVAIQFNQLAVEAFPRSTEAANIVGNTYRDFGQMPRAIEWWERAMGLIDADPDLSAANKSVARTNLTNKIQQARR